MTKTFENQTSRSMKIKRLKVRISNLKKYENQTHIDTNNIDTNLSETNHNNNNYNKVVVVNNNAEKSKHIERIKEEWKCRYKKEISDNTLIMLVNLLSKYDIEMITLLIDLSVNSTTNVNSYIKGIVRKWVNNGINTIEDYLSTLE